MPTPEQLAWAAGIFDGEGCVTWSNGRTRRTLRLSVAQSGSPEIPERFRASVGLGNVNGPYGPYGNKSSRLPQYQWNANGADAHTVMQLLWPYLSTTKREKYEALREEVA